MCSGNHSSIFIVCHPLRTEATVKVIKDKKKDFLKLICILIEPIKNEQFLSTQLKYY